MSTTTPVTAREALDLFEATVSPRAHTHIHYRTDDEGRLAIVAQRAATSITLGWLSGAPGSWRALDLLNLHHGWTFARTTRNAAVEAMLIGEGCAVTPAIIRAADSTTLYIGGHQQAMAWYSGDKRRWIVKESGTSVNAAELASRAAAVDVLAELAYVRFGAIAEVI